ncbi:HD-GYP domain-containing protein [Paenibacillus chartarius]|uniref:HD-GYP domain-containing protein n=1 Tax=Paenibacillus chartarius TaxID=747481 RepID=A0ABV6DL84_9BACL
MRIIPTVLCRPGMHIGKPVFTDEGQILVGYRVELTQSMILKLARMGIDYLYIEDAQTEDIQIEEPIRDETRTLLRQLLSKIYNKFGATTSFSSINEGASIARQLQEAMHRVIEDLSFDKRDMVTLTTLNMAPATSLDRHFCQSAINTCVYATKLGMLQGYTQEALMEIGIGALVHDIGSIQLSEKLLKSSSRLTPSEYAEIQKHTEIGFHMLKDEAGIPMLAATVALQHHERIDGSGYPYNLKGNEIHEFSRWIGLLDSYDAMTHPRAYRNAIAPHHALEILYANAGSLYDINKVALFRNKVAIFPVGLSVTLSTGEKGVVSKQNTSILSRPTVRVLKNERGETLKEPYEIDLSRALHIMINDIGESMAAV